MKLHTLGLFTISLLGSACATGDEDTIEEDATTCGVLADGAAPEAQHAVQRACTLLGTRYSWGGGHAATPGPTFGLCDPANGAPDDCHVKGLDCSGMVRYAYSLAVGADVIPGTSASQYQSSRAVARYTAANGTSVLRPGDLVFFGGSAPTIHHVAIYAGDGYIVESPNSGAVVRIAAMSGHGDYYGAIRLYDEVDAPPAVVEYAFQANTGSLWTVGSAGNHNWGLGMRDGTSPSVCALASGGYEVAFQANTGSLWTVGHAGNKNWALGMRDGTSPAIACLPGGGYEVAFQANTGSLWTVGSAGNKNWGLGMRDATSPSIAAVGSGYEVAFQANTGSLWTVGSAGNKNWSLGMRDATSPSIAAVGSGYEVAFQANTGSLWTVGSAGNKNWSLGMRDGTSPSITGIGGSFQVAFQANTGVLWTVGHAGNHNWGLGMRDATSPSIRAVTSGFEVAFQANTGSLWTVGNAGNKNWALGMKDATNPAAR